jgi:hypothetical protein
MYPTRRSFQRIILPSFIAHTTSLRITAIALYLKDIIHTHCHLPKSSLQCHLHYVLPTYSSNTVAADDAGVLLDDAGVLLAGRPHDFEHNNWCTAAAAFCYTENIERLDSRHSRPAIIKKSEKRNANSLVGTRSGNNSGNNNALDLLDTIVHH